MTDATSVTLTERLRRVSTELRTLEAELKSGQHPDAMQLQEFRYVLDNTRLTAWTVSEILNARERDQDPEKVLTFIVAERLRRSTQMLRDLCADVTQEGVTWKTHGVQGLFQTVNLLQVELSRMLSEHRARYGKVAEAGR
ncbi:MAG TPA: hypothetical protein VFR24_18490 [Candidatus Angelobacter sp.]|nr:hypothetical protein [Candidatus Angelobacter sp.]HEU4415129.1 hypothetical protein [Candidatus Angelobacter sp.]